MTEIRKVNPEVMADQSAKLKETIESWMGAVKEITSLKETLDGMWDGLANDQFNARWEEDLKKYDTLAEVLGDYILAIDEAVAKYEIYEQEIANIVREN